MLYININAIPKGTQTEYRPEASVEVDTGWINSKAETRNIAREGRPAENRIALGSKIASNAPTLIQLNPIIEDLEMRLAPYPHCENAVQVRKAANVRNSTVALLFGGDSTQKIGKTI